MPHSSRSVAEQRFGRLIEAFTGDADVTVGHSRGFGAGTLQVDGRIFAMVSSDRLVLKLPSGRVAELRADGHGLPFDGGKGRPMREWVALTDADDVPWLELAHEALTFVGRRGT